MKDRILSITVTLTVIILVIVFMAGCSTTVPVTQKFPDVPKELLVNCGDLIKVKENETKLSQVLITVTENYSKYHECRVKNDAWIEWYTEQKKIFDSIK